VSRHDEPRLRRRRLLYLVGLVPSILLLLVSARIAVLVHHQDAGLASYDAGDFEEAREHFAGNRVLNPVQRWIAPFGEGGARYRSEDFTGAVAAFTVSLRLVPESWECTVRVNLALAEEATGDASLGDGDRQAAEDAWSDGREVLEPCLDVPVVEREQDVELEHDVERQRAVRVAAHRVDERLADKLGTERRVPPPRAEEPPPPEAGTEEKEEELEERNRQAHADNVKLKDEFDYDRPPQPEPPPIPQW
jgi:hypothetical protein